MTDTPNTPEAQAAIKDAVMRFQMGDLSAALTLADEMVLVHPEHPVAHNVHGVFLMQAGRVDDALEAFLTAVKLRPDYAEAQNNCGLALGELKREDMAITHYRRAIALNENYAEAYNNLGVSLDALGQWTPALDRFRKALDLNPDYNDARLNLANLFRDLGETDAAAAEYRRLVEMDPGHCEALANLAGLHEFADADDPLLRQLTTLAEDPAQPLPTKARMLYAMAAAWDQIGDTDHMISLISQGAELRKSLNQYDPQATAAEFSAIRSNFTSIAKPEPHESNGPTPLFIVGMPRSGTTLLEQMLGNHPNIAAAGELDFLEFLIRKAGTVTAPPSSEQSAAIRQNFYDRLPQYSGERPVVTDKTPANFQWLGHICTTLPGAKILHIKRDARAVCWSIFRHDFGPMGKTYPSTLSDIVAYWNDYAELMDHWVQALPGQVVDIVYEDLVEAPERVLHAALSELGFDWSSEVLDAPKSNRAVKTISSQQVRRGLYSGSSEAWRAYETYLQEDFARLKG